MAERKFELPGIQDLSKEQERVRAMPSDGQYLVIGGPGTGKTVLTLLRAKRHQRDLDGYVFLVFNHLLDRASGQLFGGGLEGRTWIAWFLEIFEEVTGHPVPREDANDNDYREIDWYGVEQIVRDLPEGDDGERPFLVIDEGQDMPRQFYDSLVGLGFDRFFVVADQNQQITERNSSRKEIQDCLAIDADAVVELRRNYRNRYHVARLAREFYTGDPASPPPEIPPVDRGPIPILYGYDERGLNKVARAVVHFADRNPRQLIGIITPNNTVRQRYVRELRSVEVQLDNARPRVVTFSANERPHVRFDEGGILVINAQACKGLEFDTVVLADIDEHYFRWHDPDVTRRLFYVMVARARDRVFMFMKRGRSNDIESILPTDQEVLRRTEL
ncbi:MAG: ATP-binding domain-containing protein [Spirochaetaceae bacterium]|nr:ATP-binding domain-containing protein [Spirochaetaceae bacterium]